MENFNENFYGSPSTVREYYLAIKRLLNDASYELDKNHFRELCKDVVEIIDIHFLE